MTKWNQRGRYFFAIVGHLFVYIDGATFDWHIAPDDEDKHDRRAISDGPAESIDDAKLKIAAELRQMTNELASDTDRLVVDDGNRSIAISMRVSCACGWLSGPLKSDDRMAEAMAIHLAEKHPDQIRDFNKRPGADGVTPGCTCRPGVAGSLGCEIHQSRL